MSLLKKIKKDLLKINAPTREQLVCKALQTIFQDMEVGFTDKEAFQILDWDYNSKEELFSIHNKDDIQVTPYNDCVSFILNTNTEKHIEGIDGAMVFNLSVPK